MKVSIIMPCHNGSRFIAEAIESVVEQTYKNWELLVIDDSSTDNSVEIITKFCNKNDRIRLLRNPISTGMPATPRNLGISNATGRFIAFLDCDDKWERDKLEKQIEVFENNNCAISFSYYKKMDENSIVRNKIIKSPNCITYKRLLNGNSIGNLTGMYDTLKVGKVYQKEIHHEDYLMWLEILRKGFIALNTNSVEAIYRETLTSVSGSKFVAFSWTWNIFRKELNLSLIKSIYHFSIYAIRGIFKFLK